MTTGTTQPPCAVFVFYGGKIPMIDNNGYIQARIKDTEQFRQVFPLPVSSDVLPAVGQFILSIIGQDVWVRPKSHFDGSFCYETLEDDRFIIMPNWIDYFHTDHLLQTKKRVDCQVLIVDGTFFILLD
jgi:hypothetical protein